MGGPIVLMPTNPTMPSKVELVLEDHSNHVAFATDSHDGDSTDFNTSEFATEKKPPSKKEFLQNIEEKEKNTDFTGDMEALLRPEIEYNPQDAF